MTRPTMTADGSDSAWRFGRVFARNLEDLVNKFDDGGGGTHERGFLHTSTQSAPGTNYYHDVWSRDGGRGLIELAMFGCADQALEVARFFCRHLNAGDHWSRTIQRPPGDHPTWELDGNALALLGLYNAWRVTGRRREVAEEFLPTALAVYGWARKQADKNQFGALLPCVSEMTGNPRGPYAVYGVFPNTGMVAALRGVAEMASVADRPEASAVRTLAERIADSIRRRLVSNPALRSCVPHGVWINGLDGRDGSPYDNAEWEGYAFPVFHWTRQLPFIFWSDLDGYDLRASLDPAIDDASYRYLLSEMWKGPLFRRYGFVSNTAWTGMANRHDETMAGYGQGFFTQASLLTDTVNAYTLCLEGYMRLAYDGSVCVPLTYERDPWLLHECFHYEHYEQGLDHTFGRMTADQPGGMDNPGDEGNLVQAAEGLKAFRLVAGVDDFTPGQLRLMPRLPWTWDSLELTNYPLCGPEGQGRLNLHAVCDLARGVVSVEYESDVPGLATSVRLGPLPRSVRLDASVGNVDENEWARWVWVTGLRSEGGRAELRV